VAAFPGDIRPGIVHRLDRDTSGVMVVARTPEAARALKAQFKARAVEKRYVAVVQGRMKQPEAVIDAPIGRDPSHRRRMALVSGGRQARTRYRVLAESDGVSLLELFPETGRTHQIRVHLAALGNPVLGDPVYGRRLRKRARAARLALHALAISFVHPGTGERVAFEAPFPADFDAVLAAAGLVLKSPSGPGR
jgi:23S rRNA pseudouridine1911/1915/1917 synthase